MQGVCAGMVCQTALPIAHAAEGYHGWATALLWCGLIVFLGGVATTELVKVIFSPVFSFLSASEKRLDEAMMGFSVWLAVAPLAMWIAALSVLNVNANGGSKRVDVYNDLSTSYLLTLNAAALYCMVALWVGCRHLLAALDNVVKNPVLVAARVSSGTKSGSTFTAQALALSAKVRRVRLQFMLSGAFELVVGAVLYALHFSFRVFPYRFVVWWVFMFSPAVLAAWVLMFAKQHHRAAPTDSSHRGHLGHTIINNTHRWSSLRGRKAPSP